MLGESTIQYISVSCVGVEGSNTTQTLLRYLAFDKVDRLVYCSAVLAAVIWIAFRSLKQHGHQHGCSLCLYVMKLSVTV